MVAYGALLPQPVLAIPPHGWVNLHFSLLPAWRGASPVQAAIRAGDDITGASTFRLEAGMDTGPVYGVITEAIRAQDTTGDLLERLATGGAQLLLATLDGLQDGTIRGPPATDRRRLLRREGHRRRCQDRLVHPGRRHRPADPVGHPGTGRLDRLTLGSNGSRPGRSRTDRTDLGPGELAVSKTEVLVGTATEAVRLGTRDAARTAPDGGRRLGPRRPPGRWFGAGDDARRIRARSRRGRRAGNPTATASAAPAARRGGRRPASRPSRIRPGRPRSTCSPPSGHAAPTPI